MPPPVLPPPLRVPLPDCASSEDRVDDHINGPWRMIYKAVHKLRSISAAGCVSVDWNMRLSALRFLFWHLSYPQLASAPRLSSPLLSDSFLPLFCLYFSLSFWCEIVARLLFFCILMERICLQSVGVKPFSDGRIMGCSARRRPMIINQSNDLECIKLRVLTKSEQAKRKLEAYIERNCIHWRS